MRLRNPFKSLTSNSLFHSSRNRLRRRRPGFAPITGAAEILEVRAMLSSPNVAAIVSGTALTLTSDNNGNHAVNVYRKDSTHIEVDNADGVTTINGGASAVFALSSVSGITVNLGNGYDSYDLFSKTGDPGLNVGAAGIVFKAATGGAGNNLRVYNESSADMTIGGNIIVQGSCPGTPLIHTSSATSYVDVFTYSTGSLTVNGNVAAAETSTSSGRQYNYLRTDAAGNLTVTGAVSFVVSGGSGYQESGVGADGTGSLTVGLGVTESGTGSPGGTTNYLYINNGDGNVTVGSVAGGVTQTAAGSNLANNYVFDNGTGNMTIGHLSGGVLLGGAIIQNATESSGSVQDYVFDDGSGNLTIGTGGITINESASGTDNYHRNLVYTQSTGQLSTTGLIRITAANWGTSPPYLAQNQVYTYGASSGTLHAAGVVINDSGSQYQRNYVYTYGAPLTIGLSGVTITGSGSGVHDNEIFVYLSAAGSAISIAGSVTVNDFGSGHSYFYIYGIGDNSPITIGLNVTYDNHLNTVSRSRVDFYGGTNATNSSLKIKGSVILTLAQTSGTANDSESVNYNVAYLGQDDVTGGAGYGTYVDGLTIIIGGNGKDNVRIQEVQLKLGTIINTQGNPSPGATLHDEVEIDGSALGGTVIVAMSGPNAEIDINSGNGFQPTIFSGLFLAIMTGSNSLINVANGSGSGYSHVTFGVAAIAIGSPGAGNKFTYHISSVTGSIIPIFFSVVTL
jgi:hypothetical protein